MTALFTYLILFMAGSLSGWILETVYRTLFSSRNPKHHFVNPGLCSGPYLPMYGTGFSIMYFVCSGYTSAGYINSLAICLILTLVMSLMEYAVGIICLRKAHIRYRDYSTRKGNINGVICPLFTFYWGILCCIYYFLIHPVLSEKITSINVSNEFALAVGIFYGIFLVDYISSLGVHAKLKKLAEELQLTFNAEKVKEELQKYTENKKRRITEFLFPLSYDLAGKLSHLKYNLVDGVEESLKEWKKEIQSGELLPSIRNIAIFFPFHIAFYFLTSRFIPQSAFHDVFCRIDELIPIIPVFTIPYVSWHLLIPYLGIYFYRTDRESLRRLCRYFMISSFMATSFFILFPSRMPLRPENVEVKDLFTAIQWIIYKVDNNTNVCPSVHVIWAFGMLFAVLNDKNKKSKTRNIIWFVQTLLICASTVMIKQHSVIDIAAAVPFTAASWFLTYRKGKEKCHENLATAKTANL